MEPLSPLTPEEMSFFLCLSGIEPGSALNSEKLSERGTSTSPSTLLQVKDRIMAWGISSLEARTCIQDNRDRSSQETMTFRYLSPLVATDFSPINSVKTRSNYPLALLMVRDATGYLNLFRIVQPRQTRTAGRVHA